MFRRFRQEGDWSSVADGRNAKLKRSGTENCIERELPVNLNAWMLPYDHKPGLGRVVDYPRGYVLDVVHQLLIAPITVLNLKFNTSSDLSKFKIGAELAANS
jgi:hypothetical protein